MDGATDNAIKRLRTSMKLGELEGSDAADVRQVIRALHETEAKIGRMRQQVRTLAPGIERLVG